MSSAAALTSNINSDNIILHLKVNMGQLRQETKGGVTAGHKQVNTQ